VCVSHGHARAMPNQTPKPSISHPPPSNKSSAEIRTRVQLRCTRNRTQTAPRPCSEIRGSHSARSRKRTQEPPPPPPPSSTQHEPRRRPPPSPSCASNTRTPSAAHDMLHAVALTTRDWMSRARRYNNKTQRPESEHEGFNAHPKPPQDSGSAAYRPQSGLTCGHIHRRSNTLPPESQRGGGGFAVTGRRTDLESGWGQVREGDANRGRCTKVAFRGNATRRQPKGRSKPQRSKSERKGFNAHPI
jgi:hypothetical protein